MHSIPVVGAAIGWVHFEISLVYTKHIYVMVPYVLDRGDIEPVTDHVDCSPPGMFHQAVSQEPLCPSTTVFWN